MDPENKKTHPHYLGQTAWFNLNVACETVFRAFDSMPYLVGSSLDHKDFRDVDIRVILDDEEFERMFPLQPPNPIGKHNSPHWAFICTSISEWIQARTGLPIDFQIQQRTFANAEFPGKRNACGIFVRNWIESLKESKTEIHGSTVCLSC